MMAPAAAPLSPPKAMPLNTGLLFFAIFNLLIVSTETACVLFLFVIYKVFPARLSSDRATSFFPVFSTILYFFA
jgi:hypothetical protein